MKLSKLFASLVAVAVVAGVAVAPAFAASKFSMNGSTTVLPFAQSSAEAFMKANPGIEITISGGGSGNGAKALVEGVTEIANMSRSMKDKEIQEAKGRGVNPVQHVVAIDCIVPIVHPSNPVKNLTTEQLRDIYMGTITNWKEVGGPDKKIAVVTRDTNSGTYEVWEEKVMKKEPITARALVAASSGAMVQMVSSNPLAIGYDGLGYTNTKSIKTLMVNGVKGTPETARSGKIATSRKLFMYTNGEPKGDVKKYLSFLMGPEGQKWVAKEGFVTLK